MPDEPQLIISLTSFPAAIPYAAQAVRSLLNGVLLPDKIILYLTLSQFPNSRIPRKIQELSDRNPIFEIRNYDEDIRSYRKLIPALKDFPDAVIVTVDDDVWYDKMMLNDMVGVHKLIPNVILAHRAKRIDPNAPYRKWKKYRWYSFLFKKVHCSFRNIQTGVGGVLYPPHSLKLEMLDSKIFKRMAPTTDDIWFWAAAVANGTKIMPIPLGYNKPRGLKKPKELSLKTINFKSGVDLNRITFNKILEVYPIIKKRIETEK
jgi:hypothetical protein